MVEKQEFGEVVAGLMLQKVAVTKPEEKNLEEESQKRNKRRRRSYQRMSAGSVSCLFSYHFLRVLLSLLRCLNHSSSFLGSNLHSGAVYRSFIILFTIKMMEINSVINDYLVLL